ncbi:glycoside hydrolase family protein [Reticulomyxa filosa]|uniref:Glycoside hydrolase family protein n=1 Tax=Reticulomyxa filosa TaxID=46433 RepID=X6MP26_RETFI|nr:glycoside hydrolase family protein [Reticulomyxa filosa]|eukprot:ETO15197.1 glycoside hydrolase family protein [Reticulomyxa filosa]
MLVFLYSSDDLPPQDVESMYLQVLEEEQWPTPLLSTASNYTSEITGPSGVKMSGPYVWEPPNYWYLSTQQLVPFLYGAPLGGAFGFLTLLATIPENEQWPISFYWDWHCGNQNGMFGNLDYFTPPLDARYGVSHSAQEYTFKSQVAAYESHRSLFEAYSRNKYEYSTGIIHWMLNNAFPSHMWNLYDYYLNTGGAFYGTRKALWAMNNEPYHLHVQFSYDDYTVVLISSFKYSVSSQTFIVGARVWDLLTCHVLFQRNVTVQSNTIAPDDSIRLFSLSTVSFLFFVSFTKKYIY